MLDHRGRAIGAHIADRYAAFARGDQIHVVGAGGGQRDQLQARRARQEFASQVELVQQNDVGVMNAFRNSRLARLVQDQFAGRLAQQSSRSRSPLETVS